MGCDQRHLPLESVPRSSARRHVMFSPFGGETRGPFPVEAATVLTRCARAAEGEVWQKTNCACGFKVASPPSSLRFFLATFSQSPHFCLVAKSMLTFFNGFRKDHLV
jgi:hypothetical protein